MPAPFTKTVRGVAVPTIGLGVFEIDPGDTPDAVADALAAGYRHIDTATMYDNEEEVGRGIKASGVDRDEIWVTTKVWMEDLAPDDLRASAETSLRKLGLDSVDLLLLHWPPEEGSQLAPALDTLKQLREEGKIAQLGVSNFPGYAPLSGSAGDLVDDPLLEEIAEAHDATAGQVALAWLAQQDRVALLPRSTDPGRRRENLAALQVDLSDEERSRIDELSEQRQRNFDPPFAPDWRD